MYEYRVKKVTGVVDGDTIDVELDLGFNISYSQRVRLAGIDTPESRTKDKMEKALGLESKQRLKDVLSKAELVVIRTELPDSSEKYGRILGWIFIDGAEKSVNEALVADGYAWGYLGDTKVKNFEEWYTNLGDILPEYGIDTPKRVAAFMAQCGHESGVNIWMWIRSVTNCFTRQKRIIIPYLSKFFFHVISSHCFNTLIHQTIRTRGIIFCPKTNWRPTPSAILHHIMENLSMLFVVRIKCFMWSAELLNLAHCFHFLS